MIKQQPEGGGQCSRGDRTARLISTAAGPTTNLALVTLMASFWLGLDKINRLTNSGRYRLHVDLEDTKGKRAYAEYDHFAVSSEKSKYQLSLGTYSGEFSQCFFCFYFHVHRCWRSF